jgi:hypothetical protein
MYKELGAVGIKSICSTRSSLLQEVVTDGSPEGESAHD